jgi:hypothetical protein
MKLATFASRSEFSGLFCDPRCPAARAPGVEFFEPAQQFTSFELRGGSSVSEKLTFQDLALIMGESQHGYVREPQPHGSEASCVTHLAELEDVTGAVRSLLAAHLAADDRNAARDVTCKLAGVRGRHRRWPTAKYTGHFHAGDCLGVLAHTNSFDGGAHGCLPMNMWRSEVPQTAARARIPTHSG